MVSLYHGAKRLGEIPATNLLRIRGSSSIRFAGACWRVKNISLDGIHLIPLKSSVDTIDVSYGGGGFPTDPHSADRIWRLIHSSEVSLEVFSKDLRVKIHALKNEICQVSTQGKIPFTRTNDGIRYFTFAGNLVNKAVGLFTKKPDVDCDDLFLLVPSPINWASIPTNPMDYEGIFHLLFEPTTEQSIYQKQLPVDLQKREYLQDWLKDEEISRILNRLSNGFAVQVYGFDNLLGQ